jgi:hypothetical protein
VISLLKSFMKIDWKEDIKVYKNIIKSIEDFREQYNEAIITVIKELKSSKKQKPSNEQFLFTIFSLKGIDRSVDHLTNLIENRLYVKTGEYSSPEINNTRSFE